MHAVDMYDIIKTYVLPNAYERETYRIYRSSILRILRRCCAFLTASILGQLRKFTEQIRTQAKEKQRTREAVKDGR